MPIADARTLEKVEKRWYNKPDLKREIASLLIWLCVCKYEVMTKV